MKNLAYLFLLCALVGLNACGDDDEMHADEPNYLINILSPNTDNKAVGDMVALEVNVKDEHGGTVHHFNVKVYDKTDATNIIYDAPTVAHVHEEDGDFTYTDSFQVDTEGTWVIEVKVWGHEANVAVKMESIEFTVQP